MKGEPLVCHRISPLALAELFEALEALRASGRARVPDRKDGMLVPDAYPGSVVPLFIPGPSGELQAQECSWGFDAPSGARAKLVFNTRIETALSQARSGTGLWSEAILRGRCLLPVRGFYESWTRMPPRRGAQVRFTYPGHKVFLLAALYQDGRCSVVTTEPNATVAPLHSRMPLVLGPGESSIWLGQGFASLIDRSGIILDVEHDEEQPQLSL